MLTTNIKINDSLSNRHKDSNGYLIIKNNPIAKAGVFDYLESEIVSNGDKTKTIKVFRDFKDLDSKKEYFAKKPILYNHNWVGDGVNSVDGAIGDTIYSKEPYLVADLIIYNPELIKAIENNDIKELSPGYIGNYVKKNGIYDGIQYEYEQLLNSVNHLAVVEEGRSGKDLKILDNKQRKQMVKKENKFYKILDGLKKIILDETPDGIVEEINRIKNIPDDNYEGGAEAKLKAIEELEAKLELLDEKLTKDDDKKDGIDKRELIREIMAISARKPDSFNGGETEQVETIAKLAEKIAYTNDNDNDKVKQKDMDIPDNENGDNIEIPIKTFKELIEKVTDKAIDKKLQTINNDNKAIFDSYQAVKNIIGDFDYHGKSANEIYKFGFECATGEKLAKGMDSKTAFTMFVKNNKNQRKTEDTNIVNNDKFNDLSKLLNNIK